jgi:Tol biopolymer transport system component
MNLSRKLLWTVLLAAAAGCGDISTQWTVGNSTLKMSWGWGGAHLAYSVERDGVMNLFVVDDDATFCRPLATGINGVFAWSPDGARLIYVTKDADTGLLTLYTVRADGTDRRAVVAGRQRIGALLWSPDSTRFAFTTTEFPSMTALHTANADGSDVTTIESAPALADIAWSPDGSRLAYRRSTTGRFGAYELRCARADGSDRTTISAGGNVALGIRWSPDGTKVLYRADEELPQVVALYSIAPDGTGRQRLSGDLDAGRSVQSGFACSPDGAHVAYVVARRADDAMELYVVSMSGGAPRLLHDELSGLGLWTAFAWSRNDAVLAFLTNAGVLFTYDALQDELVEIDRDVVLGFAWSPAGLRLAYRTDDGVLHAFSVLDGITITIGECRQDFTWSPDGLTLAFVALRNGLRRLFTADWQGGPWSLVSDLEPVGELLGPPDWSGSGTRIAFRARRGDGHVELYLAWPWGGAVRLTCSP